MPEFGGPVQSPVVVDFKWQPKWIHFCMTRPAIGLPSHLHPFSKRFFRGVGQHGIHCDRNVRNSAAQQSFANPPSPTNGMVIHCIGVRHQPAGMGQQPEPFF